MPRPFVNILNGAAGVTKIDFDNRRSYECKRAPHCPLAGRHVQLDMVLTFSSPRCKKPGDATLCVAPEMLGGTKRPLVWQRAAHNLRPHYAPLLECSIILIEAEQCRL